MPEMNFRERAKSQPAERQIQSLEKSGKPERRLSYDELREKWQAELAARRSQAAPVARERANAVSKPAVHERGDPNAATLSKSDLLKKEIDPSDARNKKERDPSDARNKKEIDPASKALEPKKSRAREAFETSRGGFVAANFVLKTAVKTAVKTALKTAFITAPKIAGAAIIGAGIGILAVASLLAYVVGKFMGDTSLGDAGWDKAMNLGKKFGNAVGSYLNPRKKTASLRKDAANLRKEVAEKYATGKVTPLITLPQWIKRSAKG